MINKINSVGNVKVYSNPNFKSEEKAVSKPTEEKQFDAKPLANYAVASIDFKNKLKITPLEPICSSQVPVDSIKGEKIYYSNGKLFSIKDEKTKTTYYPLEDKNNYLECVIIRDKKTDKPVMIQYNEINKDGVEKTWIRQYSPETEDEIAYTEYEDGELKWATKTLYHEDGSKTEIEYDYDDKEYMVVEYLKNGNEKIFKMSDDMKFVTVKTKEKKKGKEIRSEVQFYNGTIINAERKVSATVPNLAGLEPLNDSDLVPEEVLTNEELQALVDSFEGEKTYFSNGRIESVKGKMFDSDAVARFYLNGELAEIETENDYYKIDGDLVTYTNLIDENNKKIIEDYEDGRKEITVEKDGTFKKINYSKDGKIESYFEGEIKENGEYKDKLSLYYDDNGFLKDAFNF